MRLLSKEDFKGFNFKSNQSGIDMLADVCGVALEVFEQHKRPPPSSSSSLKDYKGKAVVTAGGDHEIVHGLKLRIPKTTTTTTTSATTAIMASPPKRSRNNNQKKKMDDDDWDDHEEIKNSKKRKRRSSNFVRLPAGPADPASCPDLPGEFRREIRENMVGSNIRLIIQKELTETDLSPNHNRLSIPFSKIINTDFLTEEEKTKLRAQKTIEPLPLLMKEAGGPEDEERMVVMNIKLRRWDMRKNSGKKSSSYVLRSPWLQVAQRIQLQVHDVVQVWSFRVAHTLHLALLVLPPTANNHQLIIPAGTSGSNSTSGTSTGNSTGNNGSGSSGSSTGNTTITTPLTDTVAPSSA